MTSTWQQQTQPRRGTGKAARRYEYRQTQTRQPSTGARRTEVECGAASRRGRRHRPSAVQSQYNHRSPVPALQSLQHNHRSSSPVQPPQQPSTPTARTRHASGPSSVVGVNAVVAAKRSQLGTNAGAVVRSSPARLRATSSTPQFDAPAAACYTRRTTPIPDHHGHAAMTPVLSLPSPLSPPRSFSSFWV